MGEMRPSGTPFLMPALLAICRQKTKGTTPFAFPSRRATRMSFVRGPSCSPLFDLPAPASLFLPRLPSAHVVSLCPIVTPPLLLRSFYERRLLVSADAPPLTSLPSFLGTTTAVTAVSPPPPPLPLFAPHVPDVVRTCFLPPLGRPSVQHNTKGWVLLQGCALQCELPPETRSGVASVDGRCCCDRSSCTCAVIRSPCRRLQRSVWFSGNLRMKYNCVYQQLPQSLVIFFLIHNLFVCFRFFGSLAPYFILLP